MATSKRCIDCGLSKYDSHFNDRTVRGKKYKMSVCRSCEKIRQQTYRRNRNLIKKLLSKEKSYGSQ